MKKEHLAFLIGGFAFGILVGAGLVNAMTKRPAADGAAPQAAMLQAPAGPMAPTQVGTTGAEGGAPMMAQINELKRRLQNDPEDLGALVRLANTYHDVAMWDQAIGYYERALIVRPDDPDLLTDMGTCFRGLQEYDRALELFDRAHAKNPSHWQSLFNIVVVAGFDAGQLDRARAALVTLEAMDPPPPKLGELRQSLERAATSATGGQS